MPEPISTIWLVILGSGGYVLVVIQFFKDFLGVRKLEIEITELRRTREERERVLVRASAEEVQKYGRPIEARPGSAKTGSIVVFGIAILGCSLLATQVFEQSKRVDSKQSSSNSLEMQRLHAMLTDSRDREMSLRTQNSDVTKQLEAARRDIERMQEAIRNPPMAKLPASSARPSK